MAGELQTGGDCYVVHGRALLMRELCERVGDPAAPEGAVLVHGEPTLTCPPFTPFGHAWLEVGDAVFDFSNGQSKTTRRRTYYRAGRIKTRRCRRYTLDEARAMVVQHEHWGPWE
jgi:hypothetical protein